MLVWFFFIIFKVIEIKTADGLQCYHCYFGDGKKPNCEKTCDAHSNEFCEVYINGKTVNQGCVRGAFINTSIDSCKWLNRDLLSLSKLTPAAKHLCYLCQEDMCNDFDKMPRNNLSAYDPFLLDMANSISDQICYECDSEKLSECDNAYERCEEKGYTCYGLYQNGRYKQGCRYKGYLDDLECEEIQNNTETKEFCSSCQMEPKGDHDEIPCNRLIREETTTTPMRGIKMTTSKRTRNPEEGIETKSPTSKRTLNPEEGIETKSPSKITAEDSKRSMGETQKEPPSTSGAVGNAASTFFVYGILASACLILFL